MKASTHRISFDGGLLQRGFWLYIWRVHTSKGEFLYIGRTGDSSSPHATPPYQRMGQHLGHQKAQNMLRQNLEKQGIEPELCISFELIAYGPMFPEAKDMAAHRIPRDIMAALEKKLADALIESGYNVLNIMNCRKTLDKNLWNEVRDAFAEHFPKLHHKI
ncbi:MAG: hypothetical protein MUO89_05880 [Dehalococcoidia bacterium]|nr:hypothetical protein [Dehalococcoidia bacterium]